MEPFQRDYLDPGASNPGLWGRTYDVYDTDVGTRRQLQYLDTAGTPAATDHQNGPIDSSRLPLRERDTGDEHRIDDRTKCEKSDLEQHEGHTCDDG